MKIVRMGMVEMVTVVLRMATVATVMVEMATVVEWENHTLGEKILD